MVETENGSWATGTLIAFVLAANFLFKVPVIKGLIAHPWQIVLWGLAYFVIGSLWGLFKWYVYVHKRLGEYKAARAEYLQEKKTTELTPELAAKFQDRLEERNRWLSGDRKITAQPPLASEHKGDIIRWMSYWPFSMLGTLLNDFARKVWNSIYTFMAETYNRVAARVFRGVTADVQMAEQFKAEQEKKKAQEEEERRNNRPVRNSW